MFWIDWNDSEETIEQTETDARTLNEAVGLAYALCKDHGDAETADVYEVYGGAYTTLDVHTGELYEVHEVA